MAKARFGRGQKAMALVPLAVLSAAWTASIVGTGVDSPIADASTTTPAARLPDGSTIPTRAIEAPASVSLPVRVAPGVHDGRTSRTAARVVRTASTSGIPAAALAAYQRAETVIDAADRSCHLTWQLVAAIGRVESDHGRTGGNTLDAHGVAHPGIVGPRLDGRGGTTRILDTDAGQYDADARFDRAIGPMQFIPSTWSVVGVDADGDGRRDPQDVDDAALATAVYLCSGEEDLSTQAGARTAVFRYNHSRSYVDLVLSIATAYTEGDFTSVPNGTTSPGYVVPAADRSPSGPRHDGAPGRGPHADSGSAGHSGGGAAGPSHHPSAPPPVRSSGPATPAPTPPAGGGGGTGGTGGTGGGTSQAPAPSLPALPLTSESPVDAVLTLAEATLQCTREGYLAGTPAFNQCVDGYTH